MLYKVGMFIIIFPNTQPFQTSHIKGELHAVMWSTSHKTLSTGKFREIRKNNETDKTYQMSICVGEQ